MIQHLKLANEVALQALNDGCMPFGALLVGPDETSILLKQGNINSLRHAEIELVRRAYELYDGDFLWKCTLVSTIEPCAMCAASQYWANIGNLVYGVSEADLKAMTGNHPDNPTLSLPCRTVIESGQKDIQIYGPFAEVREEILEPHKDCWN